MSGPSYYPNYFSLEDIIVTQERVPCTVETRLSGLGTYRNLVCETTLITLSFIGFLDPSNTEPDLEAGKSMDLPLWYAMQFDASRVRHIKYNTL